MYIFQTLIGVNVRAMHSLYKRSQYRGSDTGKTVEHHCYYSGLTVDKSSMALAQGFEPQSSGPRPEVLPLDDMSVLALSGGFEPPFFG
jgi:hypothetical protein